MATYTLESEGTDDNVRIKKVETKDIESFVSVSDLKRRHEDCLRRIEQLKTEADLITDQIQEINDDENIDLTIKDIPVKLVEVLASK